MAKAPATVFRDSQKRLHQFEIFGPAISKRAGTSTKNAKSNVNKSPKKQSIQTVYNFVNKATGNNPSNANQLNRIKMPSNLEEAYRRYEAFASGRKYSEINDYYNKTGKSAFTVENGRIVRDPSFTMDVNYNQYNRAPYRPFEKPKYNEDNWWGYGSFEKWVKSKNAPKYSDVNYWDEGTPESEKWHKYHNYQDPNWQRDEDYYQSLKGEEKEKWAQHNESHFKLYENEQAFLKAKANERRKAEQRYFGRRDWINSRTPEEQQQYHDENYVTHHNKRNILDRMFGPLMNNTAAQVAYAAETGGDKSDAVLKSLKYMLPWTDDVSDRKYWSDVIEAHAKKSAEEGNPAFIFSTPLGEAREISGETLLNDKFTTTATGLLLDIATDPLTYLGSGIVGGGAKIIKGTGRTGKELDLAAKHAQRGVRTEEEIQQFKEAVKNKVAMDKADITANAIKHGNESKGININSRRNHLTLEEAEKILVEGDPILAEHPKRLRALATESLQNYLKDVYGFVEPGKGKTTLSKAADEYLRKIGDKTIAPYFNVANRKLRSTLGTLFSENAKLFKYANQVGDSKAYSAYFNQQLLKGDYGVADLNVRQLRSKVLKNLETGNESELLKFTNEASDDELRQFIYDYDHGRFKTWVDNKENINAIRDRSQSAGAERAQAKEAAKETIAKKSGEKYESLYSQQTKKEKQIETTRELLDKTYQNAQKEIELRRIKTTSTGLSRRREQLAAYREMESAARKAGKPLPKEYGADLAKQVEFLEKHEKQLSKYDKEIYGIYGKSPASMNVDDAMSAAFLADDLDEIARLTGGNVNWADLSRHYSEMFPGQFSDAKTFRSAIQDRLGNNNLFAYIKDEIDPDKFSEAVRSYRDIQIQKQLDILKDSGKLDELSVKTPHEAMELNPRERFLWNIIYREFHDKNSVLDMLRSIRDLNFSEKTDYYRRRIASNKDYSVASSKGEKFIPFKREMDPRLVTDEDITRLAKLNHDDDFGELIDLVERIGKPANEGGFKSSQELKNGIENYIKKHDIDFMDDIEQNIVNDSIYYLMTNADSLTNYNIDNIAKALNHSDLQKSLKSLEEEYNDIQQRIGKEVETEAEAYIHEELKKQYGLNGSDVAALFDMADDESRMKAYELLSDGFNTILYEEYKLGKISQKTYNKLKNQYLPQILNTKIIDNWEKLFGEPFTASINTPGKYTPIQGYKSPLSKSNRFDTYSAGEKELENSLKRMAFNELLEEPEVINAARDYYTSRPHLMFDYYKNEEHFLNNQRSLVSRFVRANVDDYADLFKSKYEPLAETFGKMYNYNFADIFLNKTIQHNELVQSDFVNNLVKSRLMNVYDPKVGKTGDKIVIPYLDLMEDCKKIVKYNNKYKKVSPELVFNKIVESVGLDPRLVGKNVSHFEVTDSQLKEIKEYVTDLRNAGNKNPEKVYAIKTDGYNMDNIVYDMLNTYTKTQMKIMQNSLLNLYDWFLTKFKILNTIINVPFHGQNSISNAFQSFLATGEDAFNVKNIKQAYEIVRNGDPKKMITFGGKTRSASEWRFILNQYNVVDNTFYNDFRMVGDSLPEKQMRELSTEDFNNFFGDGFEESNPLSFLNPLINLANKPFRAGGRAGAAIEGTQRANLFFSLIDKGYSYRKASDMVDDFLFDYGNLTKTEKNLFRRIIPFYSFLRKNVPMELANMLEQPQKFVNTRRVFDSVSRLSEDYIPPDERNEWRDTDIQLPFKINGEYYGLADNMPYTQFEKWSDPGKIIGQTSPLIKLLPEMLTGKYAYTGMEIDSLPSYAMNQVPALKILDRYLHDQNFGYIPEDAEEDYEPDDARGAMWGIGQTIGFPINRIRRQEYKKDGVDIYEQYENDPGMLADLIEMIKSRQLPETSILNR